MHIRRIEIGGGVARVAGGGTNFFEWVFGILYYLIKHDLASCETYLINNSS